MLTAALVVAASASLLLAALAAIAWRRSRGLDEALHAAADQLEQLQMAFHRFAPQDVVEEIVHRGLSTHGERREVTVLFADLHQFTAMSEQVDAAEVVAILNGYFQAMCAVLTAHNGHVDKFIGDGLMATFGAPEPNPWQAIDAAKAALAMVTALRTYNDRLAAAGHPQLQVGIGVHRGVGVAGVIGAIEKLEYTVIGDVVNTASRVEALTRRFGVTILLTADVAAGLEGQFALRPMPPAEVKGKALPLQTYALEPFATEADA